MSGSVPAISRASARPGASCASCWNAAAEANCGDRFSLPAHGAPPMIPPAEAPPRDDRTIVVALGGNALQPEGARGDIHQQFRHTRESLGAVVDLAGKGWRIAIVHGSGAQIGGERRRRERARSHMATPPVGAAGASTAGWIGYMSQQPLQDSLERARINRRVATLITRGIVDPAGEDAPPTKPIGRVMDE